jgi:hypothetical protein
MEAEIELKAQETTALVLECARIVVKDEQTYRLAAELRLRCKAFVDYFEGLYRPRVDEAWKLHGNLLADLKRLKEPPEAQFKRLGLALSDFDRRAEEAKRAKEREAERLRKEQEAENDRLAKLAAELGSTDTAEEIEATPVPPAPVIEKEVPAIDGLHYRHGGWGFNVTDAEKIPDEYWVLDRQMVQGIVSKLGKLAEKTIPGIEVFEKPKIAIQKPI